MSSLAAILAARLVNPCSPTARPGAVVLAFLLGAAWAAAGALPRGAPEAEGVSAVAVRAFVEAADREIDTMHSFMLVRNGTVVAEGWWQPEAADKPHVLWSLSKSFTSMAVGLAVEDGKLDIDDKVVGFFPDAMPAAPSENLRAMRVRDLLTMSAGHASELNWSALGKETPWVGPFLAHPVPHEPGTHFRYNTPATYMLSAIVEKVTGETVLDYLKPRLFEPLGIEDPKWEADSQGTTLGGYGLSLRTEDIARFGQLLLQKGEWDGEQVVPAGWVELAISKQVSNGDNPESDWAQGYGFQFWRCRHNAFRGDGRAGQFCIVLPDHEAVVVMTADTGQLQDQLNLVWDHLLPAFHAHPLEANPEAVAKLKATMASLKAKH